jgi:tRNA1Val (adenine37-N6)-methyltransferase
MNRVKEAKPFYFKQFAVSQDRCAMKVGTDGVLLGAWADTDGVETALDIGTGCGVIAIMLAQRTVRQLFSRIHAVEIDRDSCEQAEENMCRSPWPDRLRVFHAPIQDYAKQTTTRYDLVVSNPPFFTNGIISKNGNRAAARHALNLTHDDLLSATDSLLREEGRLCVVLPLVEGLRFERLARSYSLFCTRITEVRPTAGKNVVRLLMQFERRQRPLQKDSLVIQKERNNDWTEEYAKLTGAFYLGDIRMLGEIGGFWRH